MNSASVISMSMFFAIVIAGLAGSLPSTLSNGLLGVGLPGTIANQIAQLPPIAALFAAFLGYNPLQMLLPPAVLHMFPAATQATLLGQGFFPGLISSPFMDGMRMAFYLAAALCLVAALASLVRGERIGKPLAVADAGTDMKGQEESMPTLVQQATKPMPAPVQSDLGAAFYSRSPGENSAANLQRAILYYQQALPVYTREAFPIEWAGILRELGTAYRELPVRDRMGSFQ